jgi:hypothetical protein
VNGGLQVAHLCRTAKGGSQAVSDRSLNGKEAPILLKNSSVEKLELP